MASFYTDNQLYLKFLEINECEIPFKNESVNKQELFKLIDKQFRKMARKYHPNYGGSDEDFKFLINCKSKLLESEDNNSNLSLKFDESRFDSYDSNTLAARLGNQLFELISSWQNDLNIKPTFRPTDNTHEYEWIFNVLNCEIQLSLNVQNLTQELAELSHSLYSDASLSVLVCLFVPSKKFTMTKVAYDNSVIIGFSDKILIESSNSRDISNYFNNYSQIKTDIENIQNGTFASRNNNEIKMKRSDEAISKDKQLLEYLQNIKLFETEFDEKAADFIEKI